MFSIAPPIIPQTLRPRKADLRPRVTCALDKRGSCATLKGYMKFSDRNLDRRILRAARGGDREGVLRLLGQGAEFPMEVRNAAGRTPLLEAVAGGNGSALTWPQCCGIAGEPAE